MKKYLINKLLACGVFAVSSIIVEIFLFLFLGFGVLPSYLFFDLSVILFIGFIIIFLPVGRSQNILIGFILFFQIVLSYANICIYLALGDVFTFEMLSLVDETARVLTLTMLPIWPLVFYLVLFALDVFLLVLIRKKLTVDHINYRSAISFIMKDIAIVGLTLAFTLYSVSVFTLKGDEEDDLYIFSDRVLYDNFSSSKQSLIKFGTWGYYLEEFFRRFYETEPVVKYSKAEIRAYKESREYDHKEQKLYKVAEDNNVLVLMLESFEWYAITEELTPTLYALANGYDFGVRDPETGLYSNFDYYQFKTYANERTELFRTDYDYSGIDVVKKEGYEALDDSLFGAYGLTLTNYYSKSKTDYSEASVILGNYPYNQSFTTHGGVLGYSSKNLYEDVDYSFTLPNLLKSSGAIETANYMHSYISNFYGRDTLIPQFGFDKSLFLDQMSASIERGDNLSHIVRDSEVVDYYLYHSNDYNFLPTGKTFFSFYTTVTTHGEYNYNPLLDEHYRFLDAVDFIGKSENDVNNAGLNEEWAERVKNYHASVLDAEYAVTLIVKYLMEQDLFDETLLVLFSDHQSYYNEMDLEYKKIFFTDDLTKGVSSPKYWEREESYNEEYSEFNPDRYLVPAIIYSTAITDDIVGEEEDSHFVSKFTCAFDIPVTIFNLLGVDYNPSFYLGYPVFCAVEDASTGLYRELETPAYISCTGGIFNANIYTEDGVIVKFYKSNVTIDEMRKFSYIVSEYIEKMYKITYLYEYNMFK